jgi:predicted metalloprotease with PDZ domain
MPLTIHHRLEVVDPLAHLLHVETTIRCDAALPAPLVLFMPVWTPGSYLVREYARHIEGLSAEVGGAAAKASKVRKNAWRVEHGGEKAVVVRYRVYCNELTVRTNHLDATHAFLNGAATFLAVEGHLDAPAVIEVIAPEGWRVATALPRAPSVSGRPLAVPQAGPGAPDEKNPRGGWSFNAPSLDVLVDSPIEIGMHRDETFEVLGKPHRLAAWPSDVVASADLKRLIDDTKTILETEAHIFGGTLPYDSYLFLLLLSPRGRGGLEHASSCTLLANPQVFATRDGYLDLLSLVAHEAFHLWNVKRIRPEGLFPYRYEEENYTRQLWWFEGATSYYDWRILRRAKLCTVAEYLDHLAGEIAYLDATPGRFVHSLEDASFDAWIKLYRPDENAANSSVSYYRKGEMVCALFDLEIRARTRGRASLDDVVAHLWESFGARGVGVPEGALELVFERVAEVSLRDLFDAWVRAPGEIDYGATLGKAGLKIERSARTDGPTTSLGIRLRGEGGRAYVASVTRGAAAQRAGIDPGDELIAVGGRRCETQSIDSAMLGRKPGETVDVLLARDGRTLVRHVTLDEPRADRVKVVPIPDASPEQRELCTAWLGDAPAAWSTPS